MSDDVREWLAAQTAALHAELDETGGTFDLDDEAGRNALLAFFARGVIQVEGALDLIGAERFWPDYVARRRRHMLPAADVEVRPLFSSEAAAWGAFYVLEGSRLGAKVLARRSPILAAHPYFRSGLKGEWPDFLRMLAAADDRIGDRPAMSEGAVAAFSTFRASVAERTNSAETDHPTQDDASDKHFAMERQLGGRRLATRRLTGIGEAADPAKTGCDA